MRFKGIEQKMKRVWVLEYLSGGGDFHGNALLAMGVSMRDAMVADVLQAPGCRVSAATCARAPVLPPGAAAVQARAGESMAAFVAREAAAHDAVWLVAPETDGVLAQLQRVVPAERWCGCDAASIALAGSKLATSERLAAHGVPTPLAFAGDALVRRWVTKPDDGAGAADTQVHADLSAARDHARAAALVVEPWVEGAAMSLSLLCKPAHVELLCVNRQQIAIDAQGRVSFHGVTIERNASASNASNKSDFERVARDVVQAIPGLRGFVGIDVVWHESRGPVVIEVNPRLTCAYVGLSAALGRNLAAELLDA
jgi:tyramine---L-glutamate ligase